MNDEFDDSDDSDNGEESKFGEKQEQDFSLGRFATNSTSQNGTVAPNTAQSKMKSDDNSIYQRAKPKLENPAKVLNFFLYSQII